MGGMSAWLGKQAPDVVTTFRRFPLAIVFLGLGTLLVILLLNEVLDEEDMRVGRFALGLFAGVPFAVAGVYFVESRRGSSWLDVSLGWILPLLVVPSLQIESTQWIVSPMLPVVGVLWMSVAAFTSVRPGDEQALQQNRFWWLNQRAVIIGAVAALGAGVIAVGLIVIERSLSFLFGLEVSDLAYEFIMPITGLFLTPVYWLSMLPAVDAFDSREIDEPDFLSRAIGFLGQFILSPLLLIYALILMAYGVQIAFVGAFPKGVVGWMALLFIITGAANWLVLHPGFMHERIAVKLFRRFWFWATIIPLVLYAIAVWVRIDAYGLTWERVLLIAGGVWASLLTIGFLTRLAADIRLIPALAGAVLTILAIGPWNMLNAARWQQLNRLEAAVTSADRGDDEPVWSNEDAETARGAILYLLEDDDGVSALSSMLGKRGLNAGSMDRNGYALVLSELGLEDGPSNFGALRHDMDYYWGGGQNSTSASGIEPVFLNNTPYLYPAFYIQNGQESASAGLYFKLAGTDLQVWRSDDDQIIVPLSVWIETDWRDEMPQPTIEFDFDGIHYRLIVIRAHYAAFNEQEGADVTMEFIEAHLAASNEGRVQDAE